MEYLFTNRDSMVIGRSHTVAGITNPQSLSTVSEDGHAGSFVLITLCKQQASIGANDEEQR